MVTGASSGIGRATAVALADAGLDVVAVARRGAAVPQAGAAGPGVPAGRPGRIVSVLADVTSGIGRDRLGHAVAGRTIAVLVHGAGVFPRGRIDRLSDDDWRAAMATNVQARLQLVLLLRAALSGGRVLFVGSDAATTPRPGGAAYSVSKAASAMLWRCLAAELGGEIAFGMAKPGLVATAMLEESRRAPRDDFPAGAVYSAMWERGETIAADTVARFFRWLLLETPREEFTRRIWDIRTGEHHDRWLDGPLYLPPHGR